MADLPHNIPANHLAFCKAVARVCKEHGINNLSATYRPGWEDGWHADIRLRWTQGRHGADSDRVEIGSTIEVNVSATGTI